MAFQVDACGSSAAPANPRQELLRGSLYVFPLLSRSPQVGDLRAAVQYVREVVRKKVVAIVGEWAS